MVAPVNRRPGHSRRAQYGTFFGYLLAIGGLGIGVLLLAGGSDQGDVAQAARNGATDIAAPAAELAAAGRSEGQGFLAVIGGYLTRGSRVARLEREVAEARVKLAEQAALAEENARLKALLGLAQGEVRPVATARLIGSSSSSTRRFATISAGSRQGVRPGMAVRAPTGVIGRVIEVGDSTARVLLVTDTESTVPVRRATDGIQAYAVGNGDGTLKIRLATTGINPLRQGDAIVTSGSGGLFRPGEALAVVVALTPDGAVARPLSDPSATEFVIVEPIYDEPTAQAAAAANGGR